MIKKLRHKFIAVSVLSVFLVLLVIMGAINILNYRRMVDDSDKVLNVLAENNGEFPKRDGGFKHRETRGDWFFNELSSDKSPELPYESRYFTVRLSPEGSVTSVDTGRIAAVDTDAAREYAEELWAVQECSGFVSNYRYLKRTTAATR